MLQSNATKLNSYDTIIIFWGYKFIYQTEREREKKTIFKCCFLFMIENICINCGYFFFLLFFLQQRSHKKSFVTLWFEKDKKKKTHSLRARPISWINSISTACKLLLLRTDTFLQTHSVCISVYIRTAIYT